MRLSQIAILPIMPAEARNAIMDIVATYPGKDKSQIPMGEILGVLHGQGFDADKRWVMDTLANKEGIKRITPEAVFLQTDDIPDSVPGEDEAKDSEAKVSRMATKAAKKGVRNG